MKRGKKSLGQNFLFDKNVAKKITSEASIEKQNVVVISNDF